MKNTIITLASIIAVTNFASAQLVTFPDTVLLTSDLGATEAAINSSTGFTVADLGAATGLNYLNGISLNIQGSSSIINDSFLIFAGQNVNLTFSGGSVNAQFFGNPGIVNGEEFSSSNGILSFDSAPGDVIGTQSFQNNTGATIFNSLNAFTIINGTSLDLTNNSQVPSESGFSIAFSPVPEPSSTALLALGALGFITRRKR